MAGPALEVAAVDSVPIAERRSVLSVGFEEATFGNSAIRTATVTGELVRVGGTSGEDIDA